MASEHRFSIDPVAGLVVERFAGRLSLRELMAGGQEINGHPDFRMGYRYLVDLRAATVTLAGTDVRTLADFIGKTDAGARVAVVVGRSLEFGVARMLAALAEGHAVEALHAFWKVEEACGWLGIDGAVLHGIPWWPAE